jgi:MoaA/NifB/PqqE/SkfB family radical SAM enzyme
MRLEGLHLLLTYRCLNECDHCFVWGGPRQEGTLTLEALREILRQAKALGRLSWIYFEGGEPFLYFPLLLTGVRTAARLGFRVGLVSNAYWATSQQDAALWLKPMASLIADLSLSADDYHGGKEDSRPTVALEAAERLGIPVSLIHIAPIPSCGEGAVGKLPPGESGVMFKGRAAENLAPSVRGYPRETFSECPHEDLACPSRLHIDPYGFVHVCQGISIGNLFQMPLKDICESYDPASHPVLGPLLNGGPAELSRRNGFGKEKLFADACHLCYQTRRALRGRYPDVLAPDAMYGAGDRD